MYIVYSSVFDITQKAYSIPFCKNTGLGKVNFVAVEASVGVLILEASTVISPNGTTVVVDKFNLGRVALMALSLDQKSAWRWNNDSRQWDSLGDQYVSSVVQAVRMGQKIATPDLVKLPIVAASE